MQVYTDIQDAIAGYFKWKDGSEEQQMRHLALQKTG